MATAKSVRVQSPKKLNPLGGSGSTSKHGLDPSVLTSILTHKTKSYSTVGQFSDYYNSSKIKINAKANEPTPEEVEQYEREHEVRSLKQNLCVDILCKGYVQAFVDFFYLTHQQEYNVVRDSDIKKVQDPEKDDEGAEKKPKELSEETLLEVKENLVLAETSLRQEVITAYRKLAQHFESSDHDPIAVHFLKKSLQVADKSKNLRAQGKANQSLGLIYQKVGELDKAMEYLEKYSEVANEGGFMDEVILSGRCLVDIYSLYSAKNMEEDNWDQAILYLQKTLVNTRAAGELQAEGISHLKLSRAYKEVENLEMQIFHLQNYISICKKLRDDVGEGVATAELAEAYQEKRDPATAIKLLEQNLTLADRSGQLETKALACRDLGLLHIKEENYEKAVGYFEQFLQIARELDDKRLMDKARVFLGIAKGNLTVKRYQSSPENDSWKKCL